MSLFGRSLGPAWRAELLGEVDRMFASTGAATPGWPDPHADREPSEEEYSRCLDPGKWQILVTRCDAWVDVLLARGVAQVEERSPTWAPRPDAEVRRVRRLVPARAGGLVLLAAETLVDGDPLGLDLAVEEPGGRSVLLASLPPCGCDACDDGSQPELDELDRCVLAVIAGDAGQVLDHPGSAWNGEPWLPVTTEG